MWRGKTPLERFFGYVTFDADGCWRWHGVHTHNGYGTFGLGQRHVYAHRWLYELSVGPIPKELDIDHLCRVRDCVNLDHLEPVTRQENIMRGLGVAKEHALRTHCPQGHPYDEANTAVLATKWASGRRRRCKQCHREQEARRRARAFADFLSVG